MVAPVTIDHIRSTSMFFGTTQMVILLLLTLDFLDIRDSADGIAQAKNGVRICFTASVQHSITIITMYSYRIAVF
jgi:hypothetical protein